MLFFYMILKFTKHTNGYHSVWSKMNEYIDNICIESLFPIFTKIVLFWICRIPREDYWNPNSEDEKHLNLPTFIDIMGLDPQLSDADIGDSLNSKLMNLIINGKLQENCDLLDLGKKLKYRGKIQEELENSDLSVDIIVLVISADNPDFPTSLARDIYVEANTKTKRKHFGLEG